MCNKTILEKAETLKYVPDCCKMCNKAVENYPHALEAVDTYPSTIKFVPEC